MNADTIKKAQSDDLERRHRELDATIQDLRDEKRAIVAELAERYKVAEAKRKFLAKATGVPEVTIGQ